MKQLDDGSYQLTCIKCPRGCLVSATLVDGVFTEIYGNFCPRGDAYIRQELLDPKRMVTTTVRLLGSKLQHQVSVKTSCEVSKEKIQAIVESLANTEVEIPVCIGDVLVKNVCDSGADIVVTKSVCR